MEETDEERTDGIQSDWRPESRQKHQLEAYDKEKPTGLKMDCQKHQLEAYVKVMTKKNLLD